MSEKKVMQQIQIALSEIGTRLLRNNVGMLEDKFGNKVRYGLCTGSSDLIGWHSVIITADMVGKAVAVFTAVEVKTQIGKVTEDQKNFIDAVCKAGGIGFVARSVDEAQGMIKKYGKRD